MKTIEKILEAVKELQQANPHDEGIQKWISDYFPELKESEDEKIRKEIIDFLQETIDNVGESPNIWTMSNAKKWIAWLEKQGEKKPADKIEQKGMNIVEEDMTPFQKKVFCIIDTTIEEEQGLKQVCDELLSLAHDEIMQKSAWSEEDEKMFNSALWHVKNSCGNQGKNSGEFEVYNWLKTIKDRVQLQNIAYYNPYKEVVESIAKMCKCYEHVDVGSLQDFYDNVKVKCKDSKEYDSLFPQTTWRPSDEQMEALESATENCAYSEYQDCLRELIEQLKEL